jgi:hypothetical protein
MGKTPLEMGEGLKGKDTHSSLADDSSPLITVVIHTTQRNNKTR